MAIDAAVKPTSLQIAAVTAPAPRDVWRKLIALDHDALPYQSPEWTDVACATGRFVDASRLYEFDDGEQFVLPLVARAGVPRWMNVSASMPPSWGIGGLVGSSPLTVGVLNAILSDLVTMGGFAVQIRPNPLHADVWRSAARGFAIPRRAHVLDLSGGFEAVWKDRFASRTRSAVRKAERNVEVEFAAGTRLVREFYALLDKSFLRWAEARHEPIALGLWRARRRDPFSRFEAMVTHMGDSCRIGLARIDGQPVASIIVLGGRNTNYSRGAMDADLIGNSYANELLQKLAIEDAARAGQRYYHMGETGNSSSLSQFKEKFGAVAYDYAEYRFEKIPLAPIDRAARTMVKRLLGVQDAK